MGKIKKEAQPLPSELYLAEGQISAKLTEQEKKVEDISDTDFQKLLKQNEAKPNESN